MDFAALEGSTAPLGRAGIVALHGIPQCGGQRVLAAFVSPLPALFYRHIKLVSEKTGQICRGKGFQFCIVIGFNGIHVVVRHLAGRIHRNLFKRDGTGTENVIMFCLGDLIIAGAVGTGTCGCIPGIALRLAVKHPERDVNPLDLLDVVPGGKGFWQKNLALIVLFKGRDRILLAQLEWKHKIGPQCTAELPWHYGGVPAIRTGCGGGTFITDQLRSAGRAVIGFHPCGPVTAQAGGVPAVIFRAFGLSVLVGFHGLFFFLLVQRLYLGDLVGAPAVIALQFPGVPGKVQRACAGRTLVICYL